MGKLWMNIFNTYNIPTKTTYTTKYYGEYYMETKKHMILLNKKTIVWYMQKNPRKQLFTTFMNV